MPQQEAYAQSGADDRKMVKEIIIRTTQTAIMQTKYDTHIVKDLAASKVLLLSTIASYLSLSF